MSAAAIRAAIVAVLASVPAAGVVQAYERYATNVAQLKSFYLAAPATALRGCHVRRVSVSEVGNIQGRTVEMTAWRIVYLVALDDAQESELAFDAGIDALRDAFAADETLGDVVDQCTEPGNPAGESCLQLDDAGPAMFAGVLCHVARLRLTTTRYLDRLP